MCIVAVLADVKEGKDSLSTWLIYKYVWCKGQINITSWIYNVADGSWNYFWPSLWLFSKVNAVCLLGKIVEWFCYPAWTVSRQPLGFRIILDSVLWATSFANISKNSRTWKDWLVLLSLDRILCQIPRWGGLISTLERNLPCGTLGTFLRALI